jgi:hypothetical protein
VIQPAKPDHDACNKLQREQAIDLPCGAVAGNDLPNVGVAAGELQRLALMGIVDTDEWRPALCSFSLFG